MRTWCFPGTNEGSSPGNCFLVSVLCFLVFSRVGSTEGLRRRSMKTLGGTFYFRAAILDSSSATLFLDLEMCSIPRLWKYFLSLRNSLTYACIWGHPLSSFT